MFDLFKGTLLGYLFPKLGFSFGGGGDDGGGGGGETPQPQAIMWPGEAELRDRLLGWQEKYGDASQNRGNLTPEEQQVMDLVQKYAGNQAGSYAPFKAAEGEIMSTLQGGYDPSTSEFYAPTMALLDKRREDATSRLRRSYNLGGNLTSGARARAEGDLNTEYEGTIANTLLGLAERERQRKLDVLNPAFQYGQYVEEGPLRSASALRTVGNIPRDLETQSMNIGQNLLTGYQPSYYFPLSQADQGRSGGSRWGSAASGAPSGAAAGAPFGPWGAGIGGVAGGLMGYFG